MTDTGKKARNWSAATLLSRVIDKLADEVGASTEEVFSDPAHELEGYTAAELVIALKNEVISEAMTGRIRG
jgi:hypothetical protein